MESFARLALWFVVVVAVLQLVEGGWPRLREKVRVTFVGIPSKGG